MTLDIFLPDYNIGIEYQGVHHFYPLKAFGGENALAIVSKRDKMKYQKCLENGVKVFYVSFERQVPDDYFAPIYRTMDDLFNAIDRYIEEYKSSVNESVIRLTEDELRQIIKETINKYRLVI